VPAGADAEGAVVDLARLPAGELDEVAQRAHRQRRIDDERLRADAKPGDRREVAERVVGQLVEVRVGDKGRVCRHQQRVAVGRSLGDGFGADLAGGAGPVLHHDLLAHAFREPLRERARQDVGDAARRKRHDNVDRLARIGLRSGGFVPSEEGAKRAERQAGEGFGGGCFATKGRNHHLFLHL
jgi:hypothetical protein